MRKSTEEAVAGEMKECSRCGKFYPGRFSYCLNCGKTPGCDCGWNGKNHYWPDKRCECACHKR